MKRLLVFAAVLALVAPPAMAGLTPPDRSDFPIYTAVAADMDGRGDGSWPPCYDSIGAPYYADPSPAVTGPLGWDDYDIDPEVSTDGVLTAVKFVGGVATAPGVMWVDFYTYTAFGTGTTALGTAWVTGFGVQLPSAGAFIWTIHASSDPLVTVPLTGIMTITANSTTTYGIVNGTWYLGSVLNVGSNNPLHGGDPPLMKQFALIPEPVSLALLGVGLLLVSRRRR